jgi:signal transduction histidine kinase
VTLNADAFDARLDETFETIAFRSLTELIANTRNHSHARALTVTISTAHGHFEAVVADDGRGFDLDQAITKARATNHLGLEAMMERIDAAGGSIVIDTAPGQGTLARLRLPLASAAGNRD